MRKIPGTMATQHPDNAGAPYWDATDPVISVYKEITEAVACFKDLGVSEYMWDWEGKHADAAVIDRLFSDYHDYFAKNQLGKDKFLTFRIPNIWEEKGYNLLQAMTVILSGEDFARDLKFQNRPLFEVILPMTERADQLTHIQKLFQKLAKFKSAEFTTQHETNTDYLELIPLVESVESQLAVGELLDDYLKLHEKHFHKQPEYIRAFLACSDAALTSGFLATIIANKLGLARLYEFQARTGIPVFPIAGSGSLRFRGGLTPKTVERFLSELPGMRTVSIQSAFRYDFPLKDVKAAIAKLEAGLPKVQPLVIDQQEQKTLTAISRTAAKLYKLSLSEIVGDVQPVFKAVPKRRDRRQHIGLLAYSRNMSGQELPRAITFTAGFYSIGVPPEFIGSGRALKSLSESDLEILMANYPSLASDFFEAGKFLNKDNLKKLARQNEAWTDIQEDIAVLEELLGMEFDAFTKEEKAHHELSGKLLDTKDQAEMTEFINAMAGLRKSLG
jgi:phosphoenolpyruvate carboxylase